MIVHTADIWFILEISRALGAQPVPFQTWLFWLSLHAQRITQSRQATDPFPDGVLQ